MCLVIYLKPLIQKFLCSQIIVLKFMVQLRMIFISTGLHVALNYFPFSCRYIKKFIFFMKIFFRKNVLILFPDNFWLLSDLRGKSFFSEKVKSSLRKVKSWLWLFFEQKVKVMSWLFDDLTWLFLKFFTFIIKINLVLNKGEIFESLINLD